MTKVFEPVVTYGSILRNKSFEFSVRIVKFYKFLLKRDMHYSPLFKQLLRYGTSVGANIYEAVHLQKKFLIIN